MISEAQRVQHYWDKMQEILVKQGLGSHLTSIRAMFFAATADNVMAETAAKTIVKNVVALPAYQSFAREVQGIKAKHSGAMAQDEVNVAKARWKARGLTQGNLDSISALLGF